MTSLIGHPNESVQALVDNGAQVEAAGRGTEECKWSTRVWDGLSWRCPG